MFHRIDKKYANDKRNHTNINKIFYTIDKRKNTNKKGIHTN